MPLHYRVKTVEIRCTTHTHTQWALLHLLRHINDCTLPLIKTFLFHKTTFSTSQSGQSTERTYYYGHTEGSLRNATEGYNGAFCVSPLLKVCNLT